MVLSCDINLMCWEAIDNHLLWTKVLYDFLFFCLLAFSANLTLFLFIFLPSLLLTPHSFVFLPCLLTASGYGGDGMTCDALHLLAANNAQICTDNFRTCQTMSSFIFGSLIVFGILKGGSGNHTGHSLSPKSLQII